VAATSIRDRVNQPRSHAWADVWIEARLGKHRRTHRALAREPVLPPSPSGRDYLAAAPVRGVRTGGGEESLHVNVAVV